MAFNPYPVANAFNGNLAKDVAHAGKRTGVAVQAPFPQLFNPRRRTIAPVEEAAVE